MPVPETISNGFCFKEVLFLIKSDTLNIDLGLRKHVVLTQIASLRRVWDVFPMKQKTMRYWHEPNKQCWVSYCLANHWSVHMGCNEIISPQELNTLWEPAPSVVPREPNHET